MIGRRGFITGLVRAERFLGLERGVLPLAQLVSWVCTGLIILLLHDWLITPAPKYVPTVKPMIIAAWMDR